MAMKKNLAWFGPTALLLAVTFVGCQSNNPPEQPQPEATQPTTAEKSGGEKKRGEKPKEKAASARQVSIPAGTTLEVRLGDAIDTGKVSEGASFAGTLASPITVNGVEVAGTGAAVTGKVAHVVSSGRLSKPAELSLTLDSLTAANGETIPISTDTWSDKGQSHKKRNAEMIGGGAVGGAIIGALAGGKKGAAIGGLAGGGGGAGVAAYTGKKEIVLPAETKLAFKLSSSVTVTMKSKS
jgi:hypothetical protein